MDETFPVGFSTKPPFVARDAFNAQCRQTPESRDSYASSAMADIIDRSLHAAIGRITQSLSPAALVGAYLDWAAHLAFAPGKQIQLVDKAVRKTIRFGNYIGRRAVTGGHCAHRCIEPLPQDRRFSDPSWKTWPYDAIAQGFLLHQQWWHNATTGVRGVTRQHERIVTFVARQILDMLSPSNFLLTNPQIATRTLNSGGTNLLIGFQNFLEDWERAVNSHKPVGTDAFRVGVNLAMTPGKVVYRNRLMELIQYAPATSTVKPEPVLIVPAWIMKYYILDLSPANSLVRFLTNQGYTVFIISWKNPGAEDRDLAMDDYRRLGVLDALNVVTTIMPRVKVHAAGYCLGGTLLAITAAAMARDGDDRLRTLNLLAAQADFSEAGELTLFINESQLSFLEDSMWEQGFLDTRQMAGAFQILRSNDLIWSRLIHDYLMGERHPPSDLMAWNADATRMPYRMHAEYLRSLFLNNDLAAGRFLADGRPVALTDIGVPIFAVGTQRDHVAPWRSTYKIHLLTDTEVTFLLANGGHNAGIVSAPGRAGQHFQMRTRKVDEHYTDPETWAADVPQQDGSWWLAWVDWLAGYSGHPVAVPSLGAAHGGYSPLQDAPGSYVYQE